jgi:methylmalonyl-CoA/ethylmalonyl-CoA epimerase
MLPSHIEHIGIAVKNLDASVNFYEKIMGLKCHNIEEVKEQKVRTAIFKIGESKIELLETTEPDGPIGRFIKDKGEGIHHIALAVKDVQEALDQVKSKGVSLVDNVPRKGAENLNIAFLHPKSTNGVLMELCSEK